MRNKLVLLFAAFILLAITLGCSKAGNAEGQSGASMPLTLKGDVDDSKTLTTLIGLDAPQAFNGNPFDAAGIQWSLQPLVYDYLAFFAPFPERQFRLSLLESYDYNKKNLVLHLKKGLKWSDGSTLDAEDIMTAFYCTFGRSTLWNYVVEIKKLDDYSIELNFASESPLILNLALTLGIMTPNEIFGKYAQEYKKIIENNRNYDQAAEIFKMTPEGTAALAKVNESLLAYKPKPTEAIFSGQYVIENYSTAEVLFTVNPHHYHKPLVSKIRGFLAGDTQAFATSLLAGEYTVENGGLNVDMSKEIDKKYQATMRKVFTPELMSVGYIMNVNVYPLNIPEVRKAISWATNRADLLAVAEPGSFPADPTNSPLIPSLIDVYSSKAFQSSLTDYSYNLKKAEAALKSIGWKKENNQWLDKEGKSPSIIIGTINTWPSFMMTAEAMSSNLKDFGFNIDFRPMEFGVWNAHTKSKEKMINCVFLAGALSYAHPWESYNQLFTNVRTGWPAVETGKDQILTAPTTKKEYNITSMLNDLYKAKSKEDIKRLTEEFMTLANDLCAYIPVLEKTAPFRIYDPKLSLADGTVNEIQHSYYYYGTMNTILSKMLHDDLLYFIK